MSRLTTKQRRAARRRHPQRCGACDCALYRKETDAAFREIDYMPGTPLAEVRPWRGPGLLCGLCASGGGLA